MGIFKGNLQVDGTMAALDMTGAIDLNGNDITAGGRADFTIVTASTGVYRAGVTNSVLIMSGGSTVSLGANIVLYGQSHASQAYDFVVRSSSTVRLDWDESDLEFTVHGKHAVTEDFHHQGSNWGVYNIGPVARQQVIGSRSGGTALTNLLAKLALTGIIIDGSSA